MPQTPFLTLSGEVLQTRNGYPIINDEGVDFTPPIWTVHCRLTNVEHSVVGRPL